MTTRAGRDLVAVRATVATGLSLLLAIVAHVSAGGLLPEAWLLGGMAGLCFVACGLWLSRQVSGWSLAALLVCAQATIHFTMTALAGHGDHGPTATTASAALADALHHLQADLTSPGIAMMAAHAGAAAVTGLLLGQGERALWAVLRLAARAARFAAVALRGLPTTVVPDLDPRPRSARAGLPCRRTSVWLADTHVRRGPPALLPAR